MKKDILKLTPGERISLRKESGLFLRKEGRGPRPLVIFNKKNQAVTNFSRMKDAKAFLRLKR